MHFHQNYTFKWRKAVTFNEHQLDLFGEYRMSYGISSAELKFSFFTRMTKQKKRHFEIKIQYAHDVVNKCSLIKNEKKMLFRVTIMEKQMCRYLNITWHNYENIFHKMIRLTCTEFPCAFTIYIVMISIESISQNYPIAKCLAIKL